METSTAAKVAAMIPFRFAQWVKRKAKMARNDTPRLWVWNNDMTRSGRAAWGAKGRSLIGTGTRGARRREGKRTGRVSGPPPRASAQAGGGPRALGCPES
ncbi:hypothetical protein XFLAVUS301_38170 [Xanthobacter flavus]|uniref:Uncharacterized protein n=1 Tax=Xanthobacter flavus TaxID=281 RepID=A0A9W6CUK1_XANFL|nr:hypothetical protein XFLAVUS301_38170 [Xanthobacter flavus]